MDRAKTDELVANAVSAKRAGRNEDAKRQFREVLNYAGEHPVALNALGVQALDESDPVEAAKLFRRAQAADPGSPELSMNLARALRTMGDDVGEQQALERALLADQRHFMAFVRLAELFERQGHTAAAAERWSGVLTMVAMIDDPTPALEALASHARAFVEREQAVFAETLDNSFAEVRGVIAPEERRRFEAGIDRLLGRRRQIYTNHCSGLHFPFLPADEFFDRRHFPWLERIEGSTNAIRNELAALLEAERPGFTPYIAMPSGTPPNKWSQLNNNLDWSALHLWKDGQRDDVACARCPLTAAAVEALPLARIPGRAPTVFFSLLRPGAHLPAHTGVSNIRTIIHLPLIVPAGCTFRVGGETRAWKEGEAWAFDDTIEHEAWNPSSTLRAILIFDVWNPHLTQTEHDLLCRFFPIADANRREGSPKFSD
jgi:aspartate beta-hydroxylase